MTVDDAPLRIGVIGAGIRGQMYARAFGQISGVSIAAVADVRPAAARQLAERFGAHCYVSHAELLSSEDVDAVVVATPDFAHREPAIAAAAAGAHILIEKPLATSAADARAIADAVRAAGVRGVPAFENRWNPQYQVAKQQVEDGSIGRIVGQTLSLNDCISVPRNMLSWAGGSTPAWFLMPHSLDLGLWLAHTRPVAVAACGTRGLCDSMGIETWDSIYAHVLLEDGGVISLESNWVLPDGMPRVYDSKHSIVGTEGALRLDISESGVDRYRDRYESIGVGYVERGGRVRGFPVDLVADFVDLLRGGAPEMPSVEDGLVVTETIDALHRSLLSGSRESV